MALYVTRPRRDEVRIGRGLPSGTVGTELPKRCLGFRISTVPNCRGPEMSVIQTKELVTEVTY